MALHEHAMEEILGKTVKAVVYDEATRYEAKQRIFLVFTDGSYLQVYGDDVHTTDGISWGGEEGDWYRKRYNITPKIIGRLAR